MATGDDLQGLGMNPFLASKLGNQPANLTATGTTQATAALALTKNTYINAQSSQTGVIISGTADVGTPHYFSNGTVSATTALIYVPTGHFLNGAVSATNPLTLAQNRMCTLFQASLKNWFSETGP